MGKVKDSTLQNLLFLIFCLDLIKFFSEYRDKKRHWRLMQNHDIKMILAGFFFVSTLFNTGQAQENGADSEANGEICANDSPYYTAYSYDHQYGNSNSYYSTEPMTYTSIDYSYNEPHYYGQMEGGYRNSHGSIRFGRKFDNSDNFTSGISSYQGTSTGPGPNGGYPGAPHGIYQTHYIDTSIYPNSYYQITPRH